MKIVYRDVITTAIEDETGKVHETPTDASVKVKKFNPFNEWFEEDFNEFAMDKLIIETKWLVHDGASTLVVFYE